eukprot:TRINITY_DN8007_c0_g1_i1.p1 TRINITY_DN8007_c0_g1~~TRINITY_DN8007_c0_g1_i1.p1  ORF type:complete len:756 (-),score=80.50 TRINITY_DN8007_c0_g1_i1:284-2476(-)
MALVSSALCALCVLAEQQDWKCTSDRCDTHGETLNLMQMQQADTKIDPDDQHVAINDASRKPCEKSCFSSGWAWSQCDLEKSCSGCEPCQWTVDSVILRAGNVENDTERLDILQQFQGSSALDDATAADLGKVVKLADTWVNGDNLVFFDREIVKTRNYNFGLSPGSKFEALTNIYLARMLVWATLEHGWIKDDLLTRRQFLDKAKHLFDMAIKAFPENRILTMYLGKPLPNLRAPQPNVSLPSWINDVRASIQGFADIIQYQVKRMTPDNHFRGLWDDDCEMWRWWVPILVGFKDSSIETAQAKFSRSLMALDKMKKGYTTLYYDVEHTAEPTGDAITPMLHLDPTNDEWKQHALELAKIAKEKLMAKNQRGFYQFKSMYFSVDKICTKVSCSWDTLQHIRYMQPLLVLWKQTDNEVAREICLQWLDAWVDASMQEVNGKPKGVTPSVIRFPSGHAGSETGSWWAPKTFYKVDRLYAFPFALAGLLDAFVLAYHKTKNTTYLEPLHLMAEFHRSHKDDKAGEQGSNGWIAKQLGNVLRSPISKLRKLTGTTDFDEIQSNTPPWALSMNAKIFGINFEAFTSEVRYTDRVLWFPYAVRTGWMVDEKVGLPAKVLHHTSVYTTITGDVGDFDVYPMNAVRWNTQPIDIAMRVTNSTLRKFEAELFHFGESERPMSAELLLLSTGNYVMTLRNEVTGMMTQRNVNVSGLRTTVDFVLPSKNLCSLKVTEASS